MGIIVTLSLFGNNSNEKRLYVVSTDTIIFPKYFNLRFIEPKDMKAQSHEVKRQLFTD